MNVKILIGVTLASATILYFVLRNKKTSEKVSGSTTAVLKVLPNKDFQRRGGVTTKREQETQNGSLSGQNTVNPCSKFLSVWKTYDKKYIISATGPNGSKQIQYVKNGELLPWQKGPAKSTAEAMAIAVPVSTSLISAFITTGNSTSEKLTCKSQINW